MGSAREAFEANFEKFSTTTVIRVFNFIRTSGFLVERLFWIAVLIGFSFGTVWNITKTFTTFLAEPTASRVSFLANSTNNMSFPKAALCIEIRSDILIRAYESKIDDVIAYINREAEFQRRLKAKLAKVHEMEDKRSEILANITVDHNVIIATYHAFEEMNIHVFSEDEVALLGLTTAMLMRLFQLEAPVMKTGRLQMPPLTSVQRLYKAYSMKGANFSELLTLTAEMMCAVFQIRLTRFQYGLFKAANDYTGHNVCKYFSLPYFGLDPIGHEIACYNPAAVIIFHNGFDEIMLSLHVEALYKQFFAAVRLMFLDLGGKYAIEQQPLLQLELSKKQTVNVSLETVSTSANLRRSGCWDKTYPNTHQYQCRIWCQVIEARLVSCDCLSLYSGMIPWFAPLPGRLRSCALRVDEKLENFGDERCRSAFDSFNWLSNCSLQCYERDCESFLFASTEEANDPSLAYLNASTVVSLRLTKFVYQKVDEYLLMDATALITSLGGNLSLYLGASFLALIHIVVFFVKLPFEAACKRKESVKTDTSSVLPLNSLNLEEVVKALLREISSVRQANTEFRQEMTSMRQHIEVLERRLRFVHLDRMIVWGARPLGAPFR